MVGLLDGREDPFDRSRFDPGHVTAGAFVLSPDGRELLLVHHAKLRIWVQPGGHVEPGDRDVAAAARREVAEETGVTEFVSAAEPVFDVHVHEVPGMEGGDPAHLHFDVRFLLRAATWPRSLEGTEASRWVRFSDVGRHTDDPAVRRAVRRLMGGTSLC